MDEKEKKHKQIQLLQQNLCSIRKIAGWTTEQLGEKMGVTKQTIGNIENSKTPMSLTQYIAIRSILDYEIEVNPNNTVLPQVINILVDKGAELEEDNYSEIKETVDTVAASASTGKTGAALEKTYTSLLKTVTPMCISALIMISQSDTMAKVVARTASWLKKIMK